jgi:hypothetical protein
VDEEPRALVAEAALVELGLERAQARLGLRQAAAKRLLLSSTEHR